MVPTMYSSVYSGVPVYEIVVKNTAVMRRQSDSFLNATQILKVAGVDKARRTKILEREILAGRHEKVQGGYGKYQGTWIPFDRAAQLCSTYGVYDLLEPLLTFAPGEAPSTPIISARAPHTKPVPKPRAHHPARPRKPKYADEDDEDDDFEDQYDEQADFDGEDGGDEANNMQYEFSGTGNEQHSGTNSYFGATTDSNPSEVHQSHSTSPTRSPTRTHHRPLATPPPTTPRDRAELITERQHRFKERIVRAFVEAGVEWSRLPGWLERGDIEAGVDVQGVIDDEGRTALHWSASLSRPSILRALILLLPRYSRCPTPIPDPLGVTPLMLALTTSNCYDRGTFSEVLLLLAGSLHDADKRGRTVLHHVAEGWDDSRMRPALLYYLGCVHGHFALPRTNDGTEPFLESNAESTSTSTFTTFAPSKPAASTTDVHERVESWLRLANSVDTNGDTAVNVAARMGAWKVVRLLAKWGVDLKVRNKGGVSVKEWEEGWAGEGETKETKENLKRQASTTDLPGSSPTKHLAGPILALDLSAGSDSTAVARSPTTIAIGGVKEGGGTDFSLQAREMTDAFSLLARSLTTSYQDALLRKDADLLRTRRELLELNREVLRLRRARDRAMPMVAISPTGSGNSVVFDAQQSLRAGLPRLVFESSSPIQIQPSALDNETELTARTLAALREGSPRLGEVEAVSMLARSAPARMEGVRIVLASGTERTSGAGMNKMEWSGTGSDLATSSEVANEMVGMHRAAVGEQ
ncbi:transcriptional regulator swi6 [Gonapodya sp. JEL0774]|nr:transcriptional regulator swi6 [Gonapodya sp. JEL0774]